MTELIKQVQKAEIPFYFSNFVTEFDTLYGLLKYNPTDILICENLGFYLDKISEILHSKNVKIRVIPNICQSNYPLTPGLKTFFIRPDDIEIYKKYVDVFELITDKERQSTIYRVYKQGYWKGRITDIIPSFLDLPEQANTAYFYSSLDMISEMRIGCKKRCLYSPNSCKICDRFIDLAIEMNNIKK